MNTNATEAYRYYKGLYSPFIIFFRIGNSYRAFHDDAELVSEALGVPIDNGCAELPAEGILDAIGKLSESGHQSKTVTYRNESGEYDIPDVELLKQEKEADE